MRRLLYICILVLSAMSMMAENYASNARAEQVERTMVITYDLSKTSNVRLLMSTNMSNDFKELKLVTGDVGKSVPAGTNRTITWHVLDEFDRFSADGVRFKVETYGVDKQTFTVKGVSFTMVGVEGGSFTMVKGNVQNTLSDYMIGETEVTQELWQAVMGSNPSYFKGTQNPVAQVSWEDCQKFIEKLNQLTGRQFRLPTEDEWEYAARGGQKSMGYKYAGSNTLRDVAWYKGNSKRKTHPVKGKQPNELGLYDMSGNVGEWCNDLKRRMYGLLATTINVILDKESDSYYYYVCVSRGGNWKSNVRGSRVSSRFNCKSTDRNDYLGLRLAL